MKLFDPTRPSSDGFPLWSPGGQAPNSAWGIPGLYIQPGAQEGEWLVTAHLPTSSNGFAAFEARMESTDALHAFLLRWLDDPEREIEQTFRYQYDSKALRSTTRRVAAQRAEQTTLTDLGLD